MKQIFLFGGEVQLNDKAFPPKIFRLYVSMKQIFLFGIVLGEAQLIK